MTQERFDKLVDHIQQGGSVYLHFATRIVKIDGAVWSRWFSSGRPVIKLGQDGNLYLARGKHYDCCLDGSYGISLA